MAERPYNFESATLPGKILSNIQLYNSDERLSRQNFSASTGVRVQKISEKLRSQIDFVLSSDSDKESPDSWKWEPNSQVHREKFQRFLEYAKSHPGKIKEVNGVRVCFNPNFRIGTGAGPRVFIGLSNNGRERAVIRLHKDTQDLANLRLRVNEILNSLNTSKSTVENWSYDDESDDEFAYLVIDLDEETSENHVEEQSQEDLKNGVPTFMRQILDGLNALYPKPEPILHRDVKPPSIMRDMNESPEMWKWEKTSKVHREKFQKLLEFARDNPREIKEVNGVKFCPDPDCCIGYGADGTCVYVGLSKDGYERAVKCLNKVICANIGVNEKEILNTLNTVESKYTVRYWFYDDQSDRRFAYLVLDLCEETLEEHVEAKSQDDLTDSAQSILRQILEGLNDLHRKPEPVLHRDIKPSNIMRDTNGKWLLADFGLSRTLSKGQTSHRSDQKGTKCWRAVESYPPKDDPNNEEVRYKRQSDVQVAGMVGFHILTKGKHPFGSDEDQCVYNLRDDKPINLRQLRDPVAKDLISWMLQHKPEDRPYADQALKHPYLQSIEQQAELLKAVGNQSEIKGSRMISSKVADEINNNPLLSSTHWQGQIPPDVLAYLCYDSEKRRTFTYGPEWTECLRLIRNAAAHWNQRPHPAPAEHYVVEEPGKYFVKLFPCLPVVVHKVIREEESLVWKEREELKAFFQTLMKLDN